MNMATRYPRLLVRVLQLIRRHKYPIRPAVADDLQLRARNAARLAAAAKVARSGWAAGRFDPIVRRAVQ